MDKLKAMAEALLVEETLDAEAVDAIAAGRQRPAKPRGRGGLPRRYDEDDRLSREKAEAKPKPEEPPAQPPEQDPGA